MSRYRATLLVCLGLTLCLLSTAEAQVRVKDIATIKGLEKNQVFGYGLVVGLEGTGDGPRSEFTVQSVANMLQRFGVTVAQKDVRMENVAAVMVTAGLPAMSRKGSQIDVTVSSLGDARSLGGGMLLLTPLSSADGEVLIHAQGPVSIGGFAVEEEGAGGGSIKRSHPVVGRVPNGGSVLKDLEADLASGDQIQILLRHPDFTSAARMAEAISAQFGDGTAVALDAATVSVEIPSDYRKPEMRVQFISGLEGLVFVPDQAARVVVNERTGTIVVGEHVKISPVAVSHGSLTVRITKKPIISQPSPFSQGGSTVVVPDAEITVNIPNARVLAIEKGMANVADVAKVLNTLGVTPMDIVAIFQALKEAGALQGELVIM